MTEIADSGRYGEVAGGAQSDSHSTPDPEHANTHRGKSAIHREHCALGHSIRKYSSAESSASLTTKQPPANSEPSLAPPRARISPKTKKQRIYNFLRRRSIFPLRARIRSRRLFHNSNAGDSNLRPQMNEKAEWPEARAVMILIGAVSGERAKKCRLIQ